MPQCKIVEFLFAIFPLKRWQDFLIRRHLQVCPRCQEQLAIRDEILDLMISEEQVPDVGHLGGDFESKLKDRRTKKKVHSFRWKWAYGAAAALVLVAGILAVSNISRWQSGQKEEIRGDHFRINYIRVEGEPAQAYLFKPQGTDMIVVWAQKNIAGESE